jgi:hypothetical protein
LLNVLLREIGEFSVFKVAPLAKLGSGALAPPICEAKAITSNEFCKKSIINAFP